MRDQVFDREEVRWLPARTRAVRAGPWRRVKGSRPLAGGTGPGARTSSKSDGERGAGRSASAAIFIGRRSAGPRPVARVARWASSSSRSRRCASGEDDGPGAAVLAAEQSASARSRPSRQPASGAARGGGSCNAADQGPERGVAAEDAGETGQWSASPIRQAGRPGGAHLQRVDLPVELGARSGGAAGGGRRLSLQGDALAAQSVLELARRVRSSPSGPRPAAGSGRPSGHGGDGALLAAGCQFQPRGSAPWTSRVDGRLPPASAAYTRFVGVLSASLEGGKGARWRIGSGGKRPAERRAGRGGGNSGGSAAGRGERPERRRRGTSATWPKADGTARKQAREKGSGTGSSCGLILSPFCVRLALRPSRCPSRARDAVVQRDLWHEIGPAPILWP